MSCDIGFPDAAGVKPFKSSQQQFLLLLLWRSDPYFYGMHIALCAAGHMVPTCEPFILSTTDMPFQSDG